MEPRSKKCTLCTSYRIYLKWNALRFFSIGILIYLANSKHNSDLHDITNECCNCYFISKNPDTPPNNISKDRRFDLSYCIPECTDCNWCDGHQEIQPDEGTCIWPGYKEPDSWYDINVWFSPSLNDVTGCSSNVSITSLYVFSKSYEAYGNFAVVTGSVYFAAMIILLFLFKDRYDTISIFIFIYNVVMAELFLYWLFKPYQYHREELTFQEDTKVQCEVDLIDSTAEDMLTVIIFSSFGLLALQIFYCCGSCCKLIKKACCMWSHGDNRRSSITSHLIDEHGNTKKCDKDCCCYYLWTTIGIIVVLIMIFFAIILVWAHIVMVKATYDRNDNMEKKLYIWIVNTLLFLSLFDICFFPFCRKNIGSFVYHKIKAQFSSIGSAEL